MSHINLSTIEILHIIFFHLLWCLRRPFTLQNSSWIEEGQVAAKKFISEYISWIQECPIRFLSNTSLTFEEQTSTLYTPHYEQPTQAALCPSCSCQKEWRYNRGAGELKPLARGEEVHIQTKSGSWKPATVLGQYSTPRSYNVGSNDGRECRTNRHHLLTTRSLSAKGNPWGQGHKPEMSTATWESIEETESKPMFNEKPTDVLTFRSVCSVRREM